MDIKELEEKLKEMLLEDIDMLEEVVSQLHGWNGSFEDLVWYNNDDDFFETYFNGKVVEAVRATQYGDYNYSDEYVKFDGYGNLESGDGRKATQSLIDEIDDIVSTCIDECDHIDINEINELFEEYEESQEDEEE